MGCAKTLVRLGVLAAAAASAASQASGPGPAAYRAQQDAQLLQQGWLQLFSLEGVDSLAVCNDGSPGGYYFNPSTEGPSAPWLIYLMGGDWCYNQESCEARMTATQFQVSSTKWSNFVQQGGVFAPGAGNPFASYNKVYVEYCSSDAWMGDVPASPATFNMAFRGQRIVSATLTDLAETQGLPSGAEVVFGGCSAGARGAMVLLDSVASMLPSGATVRGLLDSGLWLDVAPLDSAEMSLMEQAQLAYGLFDPSAVVSAACASAYPTSLWQCIYGVYRMPFVQSNYFINAAQFDDFQLLYDTSGTVPQTVGQVQYADEYQAATVAALEPLVKSGNGIFSATCMAHCLTSDAQYMASFQAGGQNIAQAIAQWLQGQSPVDISSCQGYPCVQQCPDGAAIYGIQTATQNSQPTSRTQEALMGVERDGTFLETGFAQPGAAAGPQAAPAEAAAASPPPATDKKSVWIFSQMQLMGGGSHAKEAKATGATAGAGYVTDPSSTSPTAGSSQQAQAPTTQPTGSADSWLGQGRKLL